MRFRWLWVAGVNWAISLWHEQISDIIAFRILSRVVQLSTAFGQQENMNYNVSMSTRDLYKIQRLCQLRRHELNANIFFQTTYFSTCVKRASPNLRCLNCGNIKRMSYVYHRNITSKTGSSVGSVINPLDELQKYVGKV